MKRHNYPRICDECRRWATHYAMGLCVKCFVARGYSLVRERHEEAERERRAEHATEGETVARASRD